jgi:hypothetical protein
MNENELLLIALTAAVVNNLVLDRYRADTTPRPPDPAPTRPTPTSAASARRLRSRRLRGSHCFSPLQLPTP